MGSTTKVLSHSEAHTHTEYIVTRHERIWLANRNPVASIWNHDITFGWSSRNIKEPWTSSGKFNENCISRLASTDEFIFPSHTQTHSTLSPVLNVVHASRMKRYEIHWVLLKLVLQLAFRESCWIFCFRPVNTGWDNEMGISWVCLEHRVVSSESKPKLKRKALSFLALVSFTNSR